MLSVRFALHASRLSRAAIFAGAAACSSWTPAPKVAPPPYPPPADPIIAQHFASAPPPAQAKASVRGFITSDGAPLTHISVRATHATGTELRTTTGAHGEYSFIDVDPGQWVLVVDYDPNSGMRRPTDYYEPPQEKIVLEVGKNERRDIRLTTPPPPPTDTSPCCKPYGAPPARRRVV